VRPLPSPGVDLQGPYRSASRRCPGGDSAGIYQLINLFLRRCACCSLSVFAIGIMPYITASIIIQLLTVRHPAVRGNCAKEGQSGQNKMTQYTRYLSIALAVPGRPPAWSRSRPRGQLLQCNQDILARQGHLRHDHHRARDDRGRRPSSCGSVSRSPSVASATVMSLLIFAGIAARIPTEGKSILDSRGGADLRPGVCGRVS